MRETRSDCLWIHEIYRSFETTKIILRQSNEKEYVPFTVNEFTRKIQLIAKIIGKNSDESTTRNIENYIWHVFLLSLFFSFSFRMSFFFFFFFLVKLEARISQDKRRNVCRDL